MNRPVIFTLAERTAMERARLMDQLEALRERMDEARAEQDQRRSTARGVAFAAPFTSLIAFGSAWTIDHWSGWVLFGATMVVVVVGCACHYVAYYANTKAHAVRMAMLEKRRAELVQGGGQ